jgi:hypothetical protein
MTNNTEHDRPPSIWEVATVAAGDDTYYRVTPFDPTVTGVLVWHWCVNNPEGPRWMAAGVAHHTLVSLDPLHLEPSVLWGCCGKHGYIRDGRWTSA